MRNQPAPPGTVEMSIDMTEIYPEFGLAVLSVCRNFLDQVAEMLMRIIEIAEEHGPTNWVVTAIDHGPAA
jgi:hypothetical protein